MSIPKSIISIVVATLCVDVCFSQTTMDCSTNCKCEDWKMECTDKIPKFTLANVTDITLSKLQSDELIPGIFCNVTWPSVTKLTIVAAEDVYLCNNVFKCLDGIKALKIENNDHEVHLYNGSFAGLVNVSLLDLSWCSRIISKDLYTALLSDTILPRLSNLVLVEVGKSYGPIELTQDFINVLGARNIVDINLSYTEVSISMTDIRPICDSLLSINISNVIISDSSKVDKSSSCKSLRKVDLSEATFPKTRPLPKTVTFKDLSVDVSRLPSGLIKTLTVIYANRLISTHHTVSFINYTMNLTVNNMFTEIHATGYRVPSFDLEISLTPNNLQYLDLSSNAIANIGLNVFKNLKHLRRIDLANNKLSETNSFNKTFSGLFQNNPYLEELDLSNNGLFYLPRNTFAANLKIIYLYLSGNAFKKITFDISHLSSLLFLDLRNNKIVTLDERSRDDLDALYEKHHRLLTGEDVNKTMLDLRGNAFSCRCNSLDFIEWFVNSRIFSETKRLYDCEVDGRLVPMDDAAVVEAKEDCELPRRRLRIILLSTLIPVLAIAGFAATVVITVKRHRQKLARSRLEDKIRLIHEDDIGYLFPVFLSYSSEDHPFVHRNILQPLQVCLD